MTFTVRHTSARLFVLLALCAALLALGTVSAHATPLEPTLSITQIEARLAASPPGLPGYFKTVVRGSEVVTIPALIIGTTSGFGAVEDNDADSLVMFESSGPIIERIGGIAMGMSGSPLYIVDGDGDKLVGAVAYGDWFTLRGTGLATPIGAMGAVGGNIEVSRIVRTSRPIVTSKGVKSTVIITTDPESFKAAEEGGAIVVEPLSSVFVGGLKPGSAAFKALEKASRVAGLTLRTEAPLGRRDTFETTFTPGSAMAALITRGDLLFGGIGTVTYVNDDNVVGFGHPLMHEGETGIYLANAWIEGVWPSTMFPFKLARPGKIQGTLLEDRWAAVAGRVGETPHELIVTARATDAATGRSADTTSWIPQHAMESPSLMDFPLAPFATSIAGSRLYDQRVRAGSAQTTTTVMVHDGTDMHTIVQTNTVDSAWDVLGRVNDDVWEITSRLNSVNANGITVAHVHSVNLESTFSTARRAASIVDVRVPQGLKTGENRVTVMYHQFGRAATQTVDVTLTIPADVPLNGTLTVTGGADQSSGDFPGVDEVDEKEPSSQSNIDRRSLADVIKEIEDVPAVGNIALSYTSPGEEPELDEDLDIEFNSLSGPSTPATASVETDLVMSGFVSKSATQITLMPVGPVAYKASALIEGVVKGADSGEVEIYRTFVGESEHLLTKVKLSSEGMFEAPAPQMTKNAKFRVVYLGTSSTLESNALLSVKTRAAIMLRTSTTSVARGKYLTLTASVMPTGTTGTVVFERLNGRSWTRIGTRSLSAGSASLRFKATTLGSNSVRVRYVGGAVNAAATSSVKRFTVR